MSASTARDGFPDDSPGVSVMLDAGDGTGAVLVCWLARNRGRDDPSYRAHVASYGFLGAAACDPGAVRLEELCGQCAARLLLPHLPLTAAAGWVRVAERAAAARRA
jgi:hypothetical protein